MKGYEIKFNVYADTKKEADDAAAEIRKFIDSLGQQGRAVTANKIAAAVRKYGNNIFVTNYFR